jgi:glucosyl-dolichyl phosphate glucuronosyltransferase
VEQADGSVVSRLADAVVQAESAVAKGDTKASDATIVVATYDAKRWPFLSNAVESLLSGPERPNRVVVCVDQNEELYERIHLAWPEVTALLNSGDPGASGTRNAGAKYADTPFIVFLDDDVRLLEGWLTRLLAPLADPRVVGTGGGVVAGWQTGRPKWFPEEFDWVVGASFRGMPTVQSAVRNVWAENMAVRTDVFRAVGGFRTDFGKVGSRNSPEDTDLCIRMAASVPQATWVYAPDAIVEHHVPASRASFSFFLRRSYNEGRGKVEMADLLGRQEKLKDERDYVLRTLPAGILRGLRTVTRHGDLGGLLKAGAIVAGALAAGIGAAVRIRKHAGK